MKNLNHSRSGGAVSRMNTRAPLLPWGWVKTQEDLGQPSAAASSTASHVVPKRQASDRARLCCSIPFCLSKCSSHQRTVVYERGRGWGAHQNPAHHSPYPSGPGCVHLEQGVSVFSKARFCQEKRHFSDFPSYPLEMMPQILFGSSTL